MVQAIKSLILLVALLALQGCASLSREECERGDWQGIGYQDGSRGYRESRFGDHLKACSEHRITPDFSLYQQGRQRGLEERYCLPGSGYHEGLSGSTYRDVCPASMKATFTAAYRYGQEIHRLQQGIDELGGEISQCDARIEEIDQDIRQIRRQLRKAQKLPDEKRRRLRRELRLADRERLEELALRKRLHRRYLRLKDLVWERRLSSPYQ